jgi:hypothetical protein
MQLRDGINQPATMEVTVYRDQHGRKWDVTLDRETLAHLGVPIPRFRAPLAVPPQYVRTDRKRLGRARVDYDAWEAEWETANTEWQRRRLVIARTEKDPDVIAEMMGEMPQSPEFVRAARAGNRWVLGLPHPEAGKRYTCPPALQPLMDRIGPRQTTSADLAARERISRAQYADVDEDAPESEQMAAPSPTWDAAETEPDGDDEGSDVGAPHDDDDGLDGFDDDLESDLDDDLDPPPAATVTKASTRGRRTRTGG